MHEKYLWACTFSELTPSNESTILSGLKCRCDICHSDNYTCETDGFCFASTSLDKEGKPEYSYRYDCIQFMTLINHDSSITRNESSAIL